MASHGIWIATWLLAFPFEPQLTTSLLCEYLMAKWNVVSFLKMLLSALSDLLGPHILISFAQMKYVH